MKILLSLAALIALSVPDDEPGLHAPLTDLLGPHVERGVVDYAGLKEKEGALDAYLAALSRVDPEELGRDEALAFWINGYNAFTLKLMLERYPAIESIKDIPSSKRWKAKRWLVKGKRYSLDQIEHEILRPMGEPRIHFAIVCASLSCPDLAPEAYVAETLDEQLTSVTKRFLADRDKGLSFGKEAGWLYGTNYVLRVSKIFDWFEQDFEADDSSVVDFVLKYAPADAAAFIKTHRKDLDVEHLSYDWSLNGR
ncbi:MAG: DUF547 domain-containing protein [Planctomycetota bacterium]|jgi:hypothetical protein